MNRLAKEKSPYLQQHAQNPVDWYPWGDEAFAEARKRDVPVFLSVGYSTCHWCHVMERESFEDTEVADLLNEHFVSIKVDREERPDVDQIYMAACQAMTGRGGWPLTVLMAPNKEPFFAGTYFPKQSRQGLTGLMDILTTVARKWEDERDELTRVSENVAQSLQSHLGENREGDLRDANIHEGFRQLRDAFDPQFGGFGPAPKFPTPHNLRFLLRYWRWTGEEEALTMVEKTLRSMHAGGIYDHLGYGFSRYSVDRMWLVPHFEKMLYDNSFLAMTYLEAHQVTGKAFYGRVADEIFQYVLRDMTSPEGGFYSAEDADSEGEEGKFYLWTPTEIIEVLGEEVGEAFCQRYDVTAEGNFEGRNILNRIDKDGHPGDRDDVDGVGDLAEARARLLDHRSDRVHPHKDDKVLTSWNALMIAALARGSRVLKSMEYLDAAIGAAEFILSNLRDENGRLLARYRDGEAAHLAYLDDYAFLVSAMLELYDADMDPQWLQRAIQLQREQDHLFWDSEDSGYFFYGHDAEDLLARPKPVQDGAMPSGNSTSALNLLRLGHLVGDEEYHRRAENLLESFSGEVGQHPSGYTQSLSATLAALSPGKQVVVVSRGDRTDVRSELAPLSEVFSPESSFLYRLDGEAYESVEELAPYTSSMETIEGETTFYVCQDFACEEPTTELSKVINMLGP